MMSLTKKLTFVVEADLMNKGKQNCVRRSV